MSFLDKYNDKFKEYDLIEKDFIDDEKIWTQLNKWETPHKSDVIGGYQRSTANMLPTREQFLLGDTRTLDNVICETYKAGNLPYWAYAQYGKKGGIIYAGKRWNCGPVGMGYMTGRGAGNCSDYKVSRVFNCRGGQSNRRGAVRGIRAIFCRNRMHARTNCGYDLAISSGQVSKEETSLKNQEAFFENKLQSIRERLKIIDKQK